MQASDPKPSPPPKVRAKAREAARARREQRSQRRRSYLDLVVSGFEYDEIAEKAGVSVATVRREVARLLAERAPEPVDRYVAVQLSRLQKAMRVVDLAIEDGEVKAVPALAVLMGKYDRYYGLAAALSGARAPAALPDPIPATLALPAAGRFEPAMPMTPIEAPSPAVDGGESERWSEATVREKLRAALAAKSRS